MALSRGGLISGTEIDKKVSAAVLKEARRIAMHLQGQAQRRAPAEDGTLRASARSSVEVSPRGVGLVVEFNTPYAVAMHEGYTRYPAGKTMTVKQHNRKITRKIKYSNVKTGKAKSRSVKDFAVVSQHERKIKPGTIIYYHNVGNWNKAKGGGKKYLSIPLNANWVEYQNRMARAINQEIK